MLGSPTPWSQQIQCLVRAASWSTEVSPFTCPHTVENRDSMFSVSFCVGCTLGPWDPVTSWRPTSKHHHTAGRISTCEYGEAGKHSGCNKYFKLHTNPMIFIGESYFTGKRNLQRQHKFNHTAWIKSYNME